MGIDEAGRGPLAGPVVVAAAMVPADLDGITDSKRITKESRREDLYEAIVASPNARWAVAVMDAGCIDRVNVLRATLLGMAAVATALVVAGDGGGDDNDDNNHNNTTTVDAIELGGERIPIVPTATIERKGCYVVTNNSNSNSNNNNKALLTSDETKNSPDCSAVGVGNKDENETNGATVVAAAAAKHGHHYYALVDGNTIPPDMPCESRSIVKGDGKEYCIAAASILAKVTRDRLMRDYHAVWPHYGLERHKGYPTAAHVRAVQTHGASPIHRRTFRPLRDMALDEDGNIVVDG
mmetsp:Transcript_12837/g.26252  ORF Transcript_12837/g.26252 Transcript_12837/m.26252 type:complete len:295 (-) Transcript_12837:198-1082(-)